MTSSFQSGITNPSRSGIPTSGIERGIPKSMLNKFRFIDTSPGMPSDTSPSMPSNAPKNMLNTFPLDNHRRFI
jgi:hypothetical protein